MSSMDNYLKTMSSNLIKRPVQKKETMMPSILQKKTVVSILILLASIFILHLAYQAWWSTTTTHEEDPAAMRERFEEYVSRFGREYKDAKEQEMRFEIFKRNVAEIDSLNAAGGSSTYGINKWADLKTDELRIALFGDQSYSDRLRQILIIEYSYYGPLWLLLPAAVFFVGYPMVLIVYISSFFGGIRKTC
ncbi:Senescence-specific cysteine protease SAG39 [Linum grandiflorum]